MNLNYSRRLKQFQASLKDMPQRIQGKVKRVFRDNALGFIKTFHDGVKDESFNLKKLKVGTISQKARRGFPQPETPLYGLGDEQHDRSYVNMFRIREVKNGWIAFPSWAKHWSKNITLRDMYLIHEFGAIIQKRNSRLKVKRDSFFALRKADMYKVKPDDFIRIPPRPAVARAYKKFMASEAYRQNVKNIINIIQEYIKRDRYG